MSVIKSEDGWARLRANVRSRRGIRTSHMEHRPKAAFKQSGKPKLPRDREVNPEVEAVSICGLCEYAGRCTGACIA